MSADQTVSVIVLNRDRLDELACTLKALTFQTRRDFELIVVTNQVARITRELPLTARAKLVEYHPPNVSGARNAGIAVAQGALIAFCDDDAVPENTWLERLCAGFARSDVGAVGGVVIGRNGVNLQWGHTEIDDAGNDHIRPEPGEELVIRSPKGRFALKTAGTNCAFRRETLRDMRGFDEAFAYYLDEADLNMRLNASDWASAYVKGARVYHGYAASARRLTSRVPTSLFEIGASKAFFCAKHGGRLGDFKSAQRARLIEFFNLGLIEGAQIEALMASLDAGIASGALREVEEQPIHPARGQEMAPYCEGALPEHIVMPARLALRSHPVWARARAAADQGACVTVLDARPSMRRLTVRFDCAGVWHHKFGQFGRPGRTGIVNPLRPSWHAQRLEAARIALFRHQSPLQ